MPAIFNHCQGVASTESGHDTEMSPFRPEREAALGCLEQLNKPLLEPSC